MYLARLVQKGRQKIAESKNPVRYSRYYPEDTPKHLIEQNDVDGACAEIAVAKVLGKYWNALRNRVTNEMPDVGLNIQVRHTRGMGNRLIIHTTHENPDHYYFLVVGTPPELHIVGFILGAKGMQRKWLHSYKQPGTDKYYPPAYFVPQHELTSIGWYSQKGG
jgi:hypothetical protein